jgi:outer membrane protein OmpA-like peptidoglycan-associated protein
MELRFSRFEIVTGTGALFLCLVFVCVFMEAGAVQNDIGAAATEAVAGDDLFWVILDGAAPDAAARERAAEIVATVPGVAGVSNRIRIVGEVGTCQWEVDEYLKDRRVTFEPGRADLTETSLPVLDMIAAIVRGCGAAFEVASHTDATGDAAMNLALSQRRAEAAVRYLVQSGVDPDRLVAVGYGETQPLADNATEAGRAANRRLEFRILGADA